MIGWQTLFKKEILRFWKVSFQTVLAPVVTALLYLMIFSHVLDGKMEPYPGVGYAAFLVPGLVMMSVLQNAFANSSSSLIQSKITGNLVFVLLPPLSHFEFFSAYVLASMARGIAVGLGVLLVTVAFVGLHVHNPLWILVHALVGSALLGTMGVIAGIWAEKFDQLAAFQNFIIMPATFLSGVFYSIHLLGDFWQQLSKANPILYMVNAFRYGFLGISDVSLSISFAMIGSFIVCFFALSLYLLTHSKRLRA